jgi:LmbE family N-acetylglucosaminyl deacetylase
MAEILRNTPDVALAIYAHPDDPEVACGGTLALWAAAGARVHLVIVCAGEKGSRDPASESQRVAARRREEVASASAVLGLAGYDVLGYPDGEVDDTAALRGELVGRIRDLRPDTVICPDPTAAFFGRTYVNHRDHRIVGWAALDAVAPAAWSPLYFPERGAAHHVAQVLLSGTLDADVFVDIGSVLAVKTRALECHASQLGGSGEMLAGAISQRSEEVGKAAGVRHAEGFRLLTPS